MPNTRLAVIAALAIGPAVAQNAVVDVPEGREVRQQKLLTPGLVDTWKLVLDGDEMLWCTVESSEFDPVLQLVDSDGAVLGTDDGEGTRSELWLRVPHAGPVEFRVAPFQGSGGGQYRFWLQRFRIEDLAADGEAAHEFGGKQWWHWRVPVRAGDVLVPTVRGDGRLTAVFDEQRQPLGEVLGGYRVERAGCAFVRVEGQHRHRCRLELQLARRRDLRVADGPDGAGEDGSVSARGLDLVQALLRAGTAYRLDLRTPGPTLRNVVDISPGEGRGFVWTGSLDKGGRWERWLFARRDCELTWWLRNDADAAVDHTVAVVPAARPLVGDGPAPRIGARDLALGTGDVWSFEAVAGEQLSLSLQSRAFDAVLDLWDPDGNVIASIDDAGPVDLDPRYAFLVTRPGRYHLIAYAPGGAGAGAYRVAVERREIPELRIGGEVEVDLDAGGWSAVRLPLLAGQEVWLSVRSVTVDTGLVVMQPDGEVIGTYDGGGLGGDVLCALRAAQAGVYTLQVLARSGRGACRIRAVRS